MMQNHDKKEGQVKVCFYGYNVKILQKEIEENNLINIVELNSQCSYEESLEIQRSADLLLFLESGDLDAKGVLTGKLFEYMVAGVPILALGIGEDFDSAKIIKDTNIGVVVGNNEEKIRHMLLSIINNTYKYEPKQDRIAYFSRENLVDKFGCEVNRFMEDRRC